MACKQEEGLANSHAASKQLTYGVKYVYVTSQYCFNVAVEIFIC